MTPNENIFPTIGNIGNKVFYTNPLDSQYYSLNTLVDESIIYSCSKAKWAPFRNIYISGLVTDDSSSYKYMFRTEIPDFQLCSLVRGVSNLRDTTPLWTYHNRWGYDVETQPSGVIPFNFITGFKYNSIWGTLILTLIDISKGKDEDVPILYNVTYNDYMKKYDHDIYKIYKCHMQLTSSSGDNTIAMISNQPLSYRMTFTPPAEEELETIIPYFSFRIGNSMTDIPVFNSSMDLMLSAGYGTYHSTGGQFVFGFLPNFSEHLYAGKTYKHHFYYLTSGYENLLLSMAATYGLMFFIGEGRTGRDMSDPTKFDDLLCPIPAADGTYNGDYSYTNTPGFSDTKPKKWIDSEDPDSPFSDGFKGVENTDPNTYTDSIDLNTPTLSTLNVFNRSFAMNSTNIESLSDFLWNADDSIFDEIVNGLKLLGGNPISGIINLRLYPFDITTLITGGGSQEIVIGRTATGVRGIKLDNTTNAVINLGECTFFTNFKNFLDYEPYTVGQLYIPYIGVVPVSTAEFMGHKISVKMIVDFVTGACTAIVYKDDIPYIYKNGVLGIDIPVSGDNATSYSSNLISSIVTGVEQSSTAFDTFKGLDKTKNKTSAVTRSVGSVIDSGLDITNNINAVSYQSAGSSSPSCSTWQPQKCYFIVSRPIPNVPDNYGHSVGYSCSITKKLSTCSGFTVVSNPDVTISGTLEEQEQLKSLLTSGVFV